MEEYAQRTLRFWALRHLGLGLDQSLGLADVGPKWAIKSQIMDQGQFWA